MSAKSYVGNKILLTCFSNVQEPEMFEEWDEGEGQCCKQQEDGFLLNLSSARKETGREKGQMNTIIFCLMHKIGSKKKEE